MKKSVYAVSICTIQLAAVCAVVPAQAETRILTPQTPIKKFEPATPRKSFTINANDFYNKADQYGYNSYAHKKSWNADCNIYIGGRDHGGVSVLVNTGATINAVGSTCDFSLFEGTMKNGFVYKTYEQASSHSSDPNKASTQITKIPSAGSSSANFKYHGWAESFQYTYKSIKTITIEGPANLSWDRAFH